MNSTTVKPRELNWAESASGRIAIAETDVDTYLIRREDDGTWTASRHDHVEHQDFATPGLNAETARIICDFHALAVGSIAR